MIPVPPISRVVGDVLAHVPRRYSVAITASPSLGLEPTLAVAERLAREGVRVVPHLAARLVSGRGELTEIVSRLGAAGIEDVFVVAGDSPRPVGPFKGGAELLEELATPGSRFSRIGVPAYPEGHPFLSPVEEGQDRRRKLGLADYVVTQLCFNPRAMADWVRRIVEAGQAMEVYLGLPGRVARSRLARIGVKLGVRNAGRFALRHRGRMRSLVRGDFQSGGLAREMLEAFPSGPGEGQVLSGFHLYTFNEVARTMEWYTRWLDRAPGVGRLAIPSAACGLRGKEELYPDPE